MKLALFTVSYGGVWYPGKALPLKEQILKAKELGFEGLTIETKRPVAFPLDLDKNTRKEVKNFADAQGIELVALESMSNFAYSIAELRENNLAMMHDILELSVDMDIDIIKVFAAWAGVEDDLGPVAEYVYRHDSGDFAHGLERIRRWKRARAGMKEVAKWAKDLGKTVLLQNHAPLIRGGYEDSLAMVKEINMDNFKLCLDVPLFIERQSDEYIREAVDVCGDLIGGISHYGSWNFRRNEKGEVEQDDSRLHINYPAYIRELKRVNFNGYLVQEQCSPVVKDHEYQGVEEVDRQAKLAIEYMKKLLAS
jgi:sugar phosphate isomerase/epimerase